MARKESLPPHIIGHETNQNEDHDAAFMRIFYPSNIAPSIPATTQTPPFSCPLLTSLLTKSPHLTPSHFPHLACSFFTDRTAAPTLFELKRHAQSLCLLVSKLQAGGEESSDSMEMPTFDFLKDVYTPYTNTSPTHHLPLPSLLTTLPPLTPEESYAGEQASCAALKTAEEMGDMDIVMAHANELLELLDHQFSARGGLMALLPSSEDKDGKESERGIFGQWLYYTRALVRRVAELEREGALMREVFGGEHMVPSVRGRRPAAGKGGKELIFPQDRYVLAGLNDALWARLNEELDITAEMTAAKERRADEQLRPRGWSGEDLNDKFRCKSDGLDAVSWVEVTSRVFRVKGQESVFVIPAWDIHPGAEVVREIENKPLVQTVARRGGQQERMTAKERSDRRQETGALKKEIDALKFRLQYEKDQMQTWFATWEMERKERISAIELVREELDAEKEKWENMRQVLEALGLEQFVLSEGDLSRGLIENVPLAEE